MSSPNPARQLFSLAAFDLVISAFQHLPFSRLLSRI